MLLSSFFWIFSSLRSLKNPLLCTVSKGRDDTHSSLRLSSLVPSPRSAAPFWLLLIGVSLRNAGFILNIPGSAVRRVFTQAWISSWERQRQGLSEVSKPHTRSMQQEQQKTFGGGSSKGVYIWHSFCLATSLTFKGIGRNFSTLSRETWEKVWEGIPLSARESCGVAGASTGEPYGIWAVCHGLLGGCPYGKPNKLAPRAHALFAISLSPTIICLLTVELRWGEKSIVI